MDSSFVFLHIPKTAGTSFREILARRLGALAVSQPFDATRIDQERAIELDRFHFISGHISRGDQLRWFPNRRVLTVIREPIDRCVSWIYYVRGLPNSPLSDAANDLPLDDFITTNEMALRNLSNRMVRQLGGQVIGETLGLDDLLVRAKSTLRRAYWVGRQERLSEDLARLAKRSPVFTEGFPDVRANVTSSRPAVDGLEAAVRSRLEDLNTYDLRLWHWAREEDLS